MGRLVLAIDPELGVSPANMVAAWNSDDEASLVGSATVEATTPGDFFGVMDMVVIPAGVGLTVNGITAMVGRLIAKLRGSHQADLEIAEMTTNGDQIVAVRLRRARP
jgi:hypothetical protein